MGVYYSHTTAVEATGLFVQPVKDAIIVDHVTPPHGKKKRLLYNNIIPDDCERTATVALPTATSVGFISGELSTNYSTALDVFSTVC